MGKNDYRHEFGAYVQYRENDTSNSTTIPRTHGGLALYPCGGGMWVYRRLSDGKFIKRGRAVEIPISEEIIAYINSKALLNKGPFMPRFIIGDSLDITDNDDNEDMEGDIVPMHTPETIASNISNEESYHEDVSQEMGIDMEEEPEIVVDVLINNTEVEEAPMGIEDENERVENRLLEEHSPVETQESMDVPDEIEYRDKYKLRGTRAAPGRWARYVYANMTIKEAISETGSTALEEIIREMKNIHVERRRFQPTMREDLSEDEYKRAITSRMFLKNKYRADGTFEKIKARLVAGGHLQDRDIYSNGGSPTAATSSVMAVSALAAHEGRSVGTVDFPSAFLNCDMPEGSEKVYMKLDKFLTMIMTEIDEAFIPYVNKDGTSLVTLRKALYGCVESARIWNDKLHGEFTEMGFMRNPYDKCVYNREDKQGNKSTMLVHVDDVFISAGDDEQRDKIMKEIEDRFGELTKQKGKLLNFIGMTFDYTVTKKVKITMKGYVDDLIEFINKREDFKGIAADPAKSDLFEVQGGSLLDDKEREFFHTLTAKLLYLGKRVRPDILLAVSFLCKRVQVATDMDIIKLRRVAQYIRGTQELGIQLEATHIPEVISYVDASYGVHADFKSHTGSTMGIGKGPICSKSSTQKLNSKSSTESELIALSDSMGHVIWLRNFITCQGYDKIGPAVIGQDNRSTIQLAKNGQANSDATRHIAIRYFFVNDRIKSNEVELRWIATQDMIADILTKPIQGSKFKELRALLLNWNDEVPDEDTCVELTTLCEDVESKSK